MRRGALLLLISLPAWALQRVAVAPFAGDKGHHAEKQVTKALCDRVTCAEGKAPMKGGHPDFKKAKRAGIDGVVTGKVTGKQLLVELFLSSQPKIPAYAHAYTLSKGKLAKGELAQLVDGIASSLGGGESAPPPPEPPPETKPREETPPPETKPEPTKPEREEPPAETSSSSRTHLETSSSGVIEERVEKPKPKETWPVVAGEVGVDVASRSFGYSQLSLGNALAYSAPFITSPRVGVQAYPLARMMEGVPGRIGVSFDGAFAVGLKSQLGTNPPHPTSLTRLDFGALAWIGNPEGFIFAPELGYRIFSFSTGVASDGSSLTGLPNVSYGSFRVSAAARMSFTPVFAAELHVSGLPVLSTGELISAKYFSKGGGFGLEVEGGLRAQFLKNVGFALFGEYTRYAFSFSSQSTDAYQAKGAQDQLYGGRLAVTFNY